jgi:hypothetical protein
VAAATALADASERFPVGSTAKYWLAGRRHGDGRVTADPWEDDDGLVYVPLMMGNNGDGDDYPAACLTTRSELGPPPSQEPEEVARLARGLREDLAHLDDDDSQPAERAYSGTSNRRASMLA